MGSKLNRIAKKTYTTTAVYWAVSGNNGYTNTFSAPAEISCRWEDRQKLVRTATGEEKLSSSTIFTDEELIMGSFLYKGDIDSLSSSAAGPRDNVASREIIAFKNIPDLDGNVVIRAYYLE